MSPPFQSPQRLRAFTQEAIEAVRTLSAIEQVIGEHLRLRRSGPGFIGLCPFHDEGTASFTVNPSKQVWYCHGCGIGGDVFRFIELRLKCGFRDAVAQLAQRAGLDVNGFQPSSELQSLVARIKAQHEEELAFRRFCNDRLNALTAKYRGLCRAATWAEEYLRLGTLSIEEQEMAWSALERYRTFEALVEREGICDTGFLRAEWQASRGNRNAA